jgi:multidrug efflux system membrane fusion protein
VYVVNPDNTVKSQNVNVATTDGTSSAVTGVAPGQRVVTDGFDKLQDGAKITVRAQYTPTGETSTSPGNKPQRAPNQASQNMQAPRQGQANANVNTAHQNPQPGGKK